jgi:antitoxin SocA-like protein
VRHFQEDRRKFEELILYISQQYSSDELYGTTRLNKVLYFIDFTAYAKFGSPVTGAEYIRETRGPVPLPVRAPARVLTQMKHAGKLRLNETPSQLRGKTITLITPIPLQEPDLTLFSKDERELIDEVIERYRGWRAGKISKHSHTFPPWHAVHLNETIPYELAFVDEDQRFTEAEAKHGLELAQRYGWPLSKRAR